MGVAQETQFNISALVTLSNSSQFEKCKSMAKRPQKYRFVWQYLALKNYVSKLASGVAPNFLTSLFQ